MTPQLAHGRILSVRRDAFATTQDGERIAVFTLTNRLGTRVRIMEYGGIVLSIETADRDGRIEDVTLGYGSFPEYVADQKFAGALIGRYANRIAEGRFTLQGQAVELERNDGDNHLHGGPRGFNKVVWRGRTSSSASRAGAVLRYVSPEGEAGYPGALTTEVKCWLDDLNRLVFVFRSTTTRATPVSLTQHSYFNLSGGRCDDVTGHALLIRASRFTPVDGSLIPTGELRPVQDTAFDFREPAVIGARLKSADEQLAVAGGFDHNFALDSIGDPPLPVARLSDPESGRVLEIMTTLPGLQFYSNGKLPGSERRGVALEAQQFPDAPNNAQFPSAILKPGEVYDERIEYRFSVEPG